MKSLFTSKLLVGLLTVLVLGGLLLLGGCEEPVEELNDLEEEELNEELDEEENEEEELENELNNEEEAL